MLFNSIHFLIFFPLVTLIYFMLPDKIKWVWLLVASYYFYMSWNPLYAILIALSTIITYLSGLLIDKANKLDDKTKSRKLKRLWVALSFISNLAILFFFKYYYFSLDNINRILGALNIEILTPTFDVLLPVGISFYTFQALSYTMDVYRQEIYAEKNIGKYALFVSFFPQLVAGPIERSKNLLTQVNKPHYFDFERVKNGLLLMLWGFFQKLVIADRAAILVNQVFNNHTEYSGFEIAVAVLFFAFQIYCDFCGYSDIAIGAAQVLGFELMDNFKQPYFATSIQDFWRRWHISLSSWFKDYLYIPLGGGRCSKIKKYRNVMIVFLVSGLWHGASWNFIIWGGLHGLYQIIGAVTKPAKNKLISLFNIKTNTFSMKLGKIISTFLLVSIAWIFFRANGTKAALEMIVQMFGNFNPWIFINGGIYKLGLEEADISLLIFSIGILLFVNFLQTRISIRQKLAQQNSVFRFIVYFAALFFVIIYGVYGPGFNSSDFIYFQF